MYETGKEKAAKWSLFLVLLLALASPFLTYFVEALRLPNSLGGNILFFLLVITALQAVAGLYAWVLLCMDKSSGKRILFRFYFPTLIVYSLYGAFMLITVLFPNHFISYTLEVIIVFVQLFISASVLWLQKIWKW